jgi:DNA-binding transcriptional MerR regulator
MTKPTRLVFTLPEVAKRCHVHRTTLKRMEDRGLLPAAHWIDHPMKCRVYTEKQLKEIEVIVDRHLRRGGAMMVDAAQIEES